MALHLLHGSPAAAIAFYDPRLGAIVVATHSKEWQVGQIVDVTLVQPERGGDKNELD
jgi:CRISPR-associated protein Csx3